MKPVAICQFSATDGPGYFATFLSEKSIPYRLISITDADTVPLSPHMFSSIAMMGGAMSVNDQLPWLEPLLRLLDGALQADIPIIGHCLGGQLLAKCLGGTITRTPIPEIGWGEVTCTDTSLARHWFTEHERFLSFHWHYDTFSIPSSATRLLASAYCPNQAFALGKHLGMQCHIEMTDEMVRQWCMDNDDLGQGVGIQPRSAILTDLSTRIKALSAVAHSVYSRWISGLVQ